MEAVRGSESENLAFDLKTLLHTPPPASNVHLHVFQMITQLGYVLKVAVLMSPAAPPADGDP